MRHISGTSATGYDATLMVTHDQWHVTSDTSGDTSGTSITELHLFAAIGRRTRSVVSVPIAQGDPASSRAAPARILDALTAGNVATVAAVTVQ